MSMCSISVRKLRNLGDPHLKHIQLTTTLPALSAIVRSMDPEQIKEDEVEQQQEQPMNPDQDKKKKKGGPPLTFKPTHQATDTFPMKCQVPECRYEGGSWLRMLSHYMTRHQGNKAILGNTALWEKGSKDKLESQQKYRDEVRNRGAAKEEDSGDDNDKGGSTWKEMLVLVLVGPDGKPVQPLQCKLPDNDKQPSIVAPSSSASSSNEPPNIMARLEASIQHLALSIKPADFKDNLPTITLRIDYVSCEPPLTKSECGTKAQWPIASFRDYQTELVRRQSLKAFHDHLLTDKHLAPTSVADYMVSVQRVLHMIKANGKTIFKPELVAKPELMVAFYLSDMYKDWIKLPIMKPSYHWTRKLLDGVVVFVKWQKGLALNAAILDTTVYSHRLAGALEQLVDKLTSGIAKKVQESLRMKAEDKKVEDLHRINNLPSREMTKRGVRQAQFTLMHIEAQSKDMDTITERMQVLANDCAVGILFMEGFAGRPGDWAAMYLSVVEEAFGKGQDYVFCKEHKTAAVYGGLAKYLAPSVQEALRCYMRLPRRAGVERLFVPIREATERIAVSKHLHGFAKKFLPSDNEEPTPTLLRKFFHTVLVNLTFTESKLLEVLKQIDGHSASVARKHYVLRDPKVDAQLAKKLVEVAIGDTVPWPSNDDFDRYLHDNQQASLESALPTKEYEIEDEDQEDAAEHELEWWPWGATFGLKEPLPAIGDESELGLVPLEDVTEGAVVKLERGLGDREDERKPKKQRLDDNGIGKSEGASSASSSQLPGFHRGRHSPFTIQQKEWIENLQANFCEFSVAPNEFLKEWHEKGVADGVLAADTKQESLRQVCRNFVAKAMKERSDKEEEQKRRDKKKVTKAGKK